MPTISIFFGCVVQMYWRNHSPPHVHVVYQGLEALFAIETGEIIAGEIPPAVARLIRGWIERRRGELVANWENGRLRLPFNRVAGADVE